jgi:hypothetical protein
VKELAWAKSRTAFAAKKNWMITEIRKVAGFIQLHITIELQTCQDRPLCVPCALIQKGYRPERYK